MAKQKTYLDTLLKVADNEYASIVKDGVIGGDVTGYIDTGSYMLNAQISGSIYLGMPKNKRIAFAGEEAVGKTFFVISIIKEALNADPTAIVAYFESETAISKDMLVSRGIDADRVLLLPVVTVEDFRNQALKIVEAHMEVPEEDRPQLILVLDSLGNLSTRKEMKDTKDDKTTKTGESTRDMTKAPLVKGAYRVLTLKMGIANVAMLTTNHTYAVIGAYIPTKEMSGGSGLKYAADTILFLSKKKAKDEFAKDAEDKKNVVGTMITSVANKSRFTTPFTKIDLLLRFDTGLDKFYGLFEFGQDAGIVEKKTSGRSFVYAFPGGKEWTEKQVYDNPEQVYTKDVLDAFDEACKKEFLYGSTRNTVVEE
jgi:RecA/RadA recombinase